MRTNILFTLSIIVLLLAGCASHGETLSEYRYVAGEDPFLEPPLPAEFNCGPEERYYFDTTISSADDFVRFLQEKEFSDWVRLDSFRDVGGLIEWDVVLDSVEKGTIGTHTVYSLDYVPFDCGVFTVRMLDDGHASVYGCCGK